MERLVERKRFKRLKDEENLCMFCRRSDSTLYEINSNEIDVGSEIISFHELIFEVFLTKVDENNYSVCEECKNLMIEFYIFKRTAKRNFPMQRAAAFSHLKAFLDSNQSDPICFNISDNNFSISFKKAKDEPHLDYIEEQEEVEEEVFQEEEDEPMNVENVENENVEEDEETSCFEMEALNDDSEVGLTDNEYEIQVSHEADSVKIEEPMFFTATKSFICQCGTELPNALALQKHLALHKAGKIKTVKSKLSCNEKSCDVDFKEQKHLETHEKAHENFRAIAPHLSTHICSECRSLFSSEDDYVAHSAQHQTGGDPQYTIERRSAYEDHLIKRTETPDDEQEVDCEDFVSCGYCNKKALEVDIKIHLLFFHTHTAFCPIDNRCFEGFKQVRLFSEHIRNKHPELFEKSNLYNCRHCNSNFESHFEKLAHMKQCEAKQFPCEGHCDKRFATDWLLRLHKQHIQGNNRFSCEICQKVCVSKSDLQIHNRSHTNERPYECPICLKSFKTSANRASHLDIHESEKRHACEICGEKFQTRPIMRKHKKKHDSKYMSECVCQICNRQYITKPHMLRHVKDFHGAPPELKTTGLNDFFDEQLNRTSS